MSDIRAEIAGGQTGTGEAGFGDYVQLLKPRVMSLVVFTALVGVLVAPGQVQGEEEFMEKLAALQEELEALNAQARELGEIIGRNVAEILAT